MPPQAILDRLAVVTDEISDDLSEAANIAVACGIRQVEIRAIGGQRVPQFAPSVLRDTHRILNDHGIKVLSISPGLGKQSPDAIAEDQLVRAIDYAKVLEAESVIFFGLPKNPSSASEIQSGLDTLRRWQTQCHAAGLVACLENSGGCIAGGKASVLKMARSVQMRVIWDPANAIASGERDLELDSADVSHIQRVHVKGARSQGGVIDLDQSCFDWRAHMVMLQRAGYRGVLTIEPHQWKNRIPAFQNAYRYLTDTLRDLPAV